MSRPIRSSRSGGGRKRALHTNGSEPASQSTPAVKLVSLAPQFGFSTEEVATYAQDWAALASSTRFHDADVIGRAVLAPALRDTTRAVLRRMEAAGLQPRDLAELHLALGDTETAMILLEKAFTQGDAYLILLGTDPVFDPLRADPRFIRMMEILHVPNGVVR
jgi:hypothetical protein